MLAAAGAVAPAARTPQTWRGEIEGEWCFIMNPPEPNGEAVVTMHGAGEWVREDFSSWESQPAANALLGALVSNGFLVAQSNGAARNGNGMWGNPATQAATAALIAYLRRNHRVKKTHALAVSAGNLVLLNLLLTRKAAFDKAVLLAPCLSLASEYKCPGGVNRVRTIAEAYDFQPQSDCPGDPIHDLAFTTATQAHDPAEVWKRLSGHDLAQVFHNTRLLAAYETADPRVPPNENILPFSQRLKACGIPLQLLPMEANTHGSQELYSRNQIAILKFLREPS
jgi:pimeloyl-ACP methyl ester carboxylesterase